MKKTRRSKHRLPVPSPQKGAAFIDAVKTRDGWIAYALTKRGLLATQFGRRTKREAIRRLVEEKHLAGFVTEPAPKEIGMPWGLVLREAFEGRGGGLARVPVDDTRWSPFARRVYRYVQGIPAGRVKTYGEVARAVSSPGAARAVGQMMAKNPVAPVVPCHRVVGCDGSLRGFSAEGGVDLKAKMLKREGAL